MQKFWEYFIKGLDAVVSMLAALTLLISLSCIVINVFYRYVVLDWLRVLSNSVDFVWLVSSFDFLQRIISPISITADEVPGYLLVWTSFLGAYLAVRKEQHINFDLLVSSFPPIVEKVIKSLVDILVILFLGFLCYLSTQMILIDGEVEIETAEIMQGWFMAILPLASGLMIFAYIVNIVKRWKS